MKRVTIIALTLFLAAAPLFAANAPPFALALTPETVAWAQRNPSGQALEILNRVLLEESCPEHFLRVWDTLGGVFALLHSQDRTALCLSGGGIRSATFALGVTQGLAQHGILDQFDYLSTVSGGGYIGDRKSVV